MQEGKACFPKYERPRLVPISQRQMGEASCSNGSSANVRSACNHGTSNSGPGTCGAGTGVGSCFNGDYVLPGARACSTGTVPNYGAGCLSGSVAAPGCRSGSTASTITCNTGDAPGGACVAGTKVG